MGLNNRLHPERYHGFTARPPFFEGWYFKLVSQDGSHRLAIIPGVYLSEDPENRHAFIQVFDSESEAGAYFTFPYQDFVAAPDRFAVLIGENYFSADEIRLNIEDKDFSLSGKLNFSELTPWPVRFTSVGAMGWFAWVPFMECYHGVVSMDHKISGALRLNDQEIDFENGRGFIEKDWGKQFPAAWIWGQCNHFDRPGISLMLSVAVIPWLGRSFGGFIVGFYYEGQLHRFTTYANSKIDALDVEDNKVQLVFSNRTHRLRVEARQNQGGLLQAPTTKAMERRILESLTACFRIVFEDLNGNVIYQSIGENAGLEVVGDIDSLIHQVFPDW